MSDPRVSIIIPCFNAEAFVGEAIQSALDQTHESTEVIVVDDGSTDGSLERIRSFGEAIVWIANPHQGAGGARNSGLRRATGKYVVFLDADDLLRRDMVKKLVGKAEETGADTVACDVETHWLDGRVDRWSMAPEKDPVLVALGRGVWVSCLHRADSVREIGGFREDLVCALDRDMHLRLAVAGKTIVVVPDILVTVRRQPGSLSGDTLRVLDQYAEILPPCFAALQRQGMLTEERAVAFAAFMARAARRYARFGEAGKAKAYFDLARKFHLSAGLNVVYASPIKRMLASAAGITAAERLFETRQLVSRRMGQAKRASFFLLRDRIALARRPAWHLDSRIDAVLNWILRAWEATGRRGISEGYHVVPARWGPAYPETTGYLICSLLNASRCGFGHRQLPDVARQLGEWLVQVQMRCGAFPAGYVTRRPVEPAVFNTGQVLHGLLDLVHAGLDTSGSFANAAARASEWLLSQLSEEGIWLFDTPLASEKMHAYNVRTAWAMARWGEMTGDRRFVDAGVRHAMWIASRQDDAGWIPNMNFDRGVDPLLHTVAYTLRGLLELGELSGQRILIEACGRAARGVAALQDRRTGELPGQISCGFRAASRWTNTTANSQMALVWWRLAQVTGDDSWKPYAEKALAANLRFQWLGHGDPGCRGALQGSHPGHVGYGRYWYMNWTQKFFLDALITLHGASPSA